LRNPVVTLKDGQKVTTAIPAASPSATTAVNATANAGK